MPYLLNLVYICVVVAATPWLLWSAIRKGKYREGWRQKLLGRAPRRRGDQPCIWLHAVSVGEVNLLQPLITAIESAHPDCQCVVSVTTKTGYDLARRKYAPRPVFYCPLDFSWAVKNAVRRVRPDLLVLAELELWPNLIRAVDQAGTPIAVVNGRLSERSFRGYSRLKFIVRAMLGRIAVVSAQNDEYAERFLELGAPQVVVTGSLKFDGAEANRENPKTVRLGELAGVQPRDVVFLAGSTQAPEEQIAIDAYRRLAGRFPHLRLMLTPRHPDRFAEVAALLDRSGLPWIRRSELSQAGEATEAAGAGGAEEPRVLLIDVVGELQAWWGLADLAFVGGSMGRRGGQNMIEPAAYGAAVCFGPRTQNFRDVVALLDDAAAAEVVADGEELHAFLLHCLNDPRYARTLGENARQLVFRQQGAVERTLELLRPLLGERTRSKQRGGRAA